MELRTKVGIESHGVTLSHHTPVLMLGSCFSDNIGALLADRLFNVVSNPLGTLYNPLSILSTVRRLADATEFTPADIFAHGNLHHSFDCHSSLSDTDPGRMIARLNRLTADASDFLRRTSVVFLTFGTARVYEHKLTSRVVANCHKLPPQNFTRRMMSVDEVSDTIAATVSAIRSAAPAAEIFLTVSPIRHLRDGAHGNTLNKATLQLGIEKALPLCRDTHYLPAYEILNDDLRDYRFYDTDMCHPSATAVNYIYEAFSEAFFTPPTRELASKFLKFVKRLRHRPLTADTEAIRKFTAETEILKEQMLGSYPYIAEAITRLKI